MGINLEAIKRPLSGIGHDSWAAILRKLYGTARAGTARNLLLAMLNGRYLLEGGMMNSEKIIINNYGSIPHLSTSKMTQQADKKIHMGQEEILTKKARDWKDLIIVTEKLDGSNVGIVKKGGQCVPVGRSGYHATTSPYEQHRFFAKYVEKNSSMFSWLPEGWRVCGEWMAQAHGTLYDITEESPFVAFDIFTAKRRVPYIYFIKKCAQYGIATVPLLHIGQPIKIENALKLLGDGRYGNAEKPEGVVYRMEREGKYEFLAKWVRADKEDGKYMNDTIYNVGFTLEFS